MVWFLCACVLIKCTTAIALMQWIVVDPCGCSDTVAAGEFYYKGGRKFVNQTPVGGSGVLLPSKIFLCFLYKNEAFWCILTK